MKNLILQQALLLLCHQAAMQALLTVSGDGGQHLSLMRNSPAAALCLSPLTDLPLGRGSWRAEFLIKAAIVLLGVRGCAAAFSPPSAFGRWLCKRSQAVMEASGTSCTLVAGWEKQRLFAPVNLWA